MEPLVASQSPAPLSCSKGSSSPALSPLNDDDDLVVAQLEGLAVAETQQQQQQQQQGAATALQQQLPSLQQQQQQQLEPRQQQQQVQEQQDGTVQLTPEQEAAADEAAEQFVQQYEQAFLTRALQQLAEGCAAHGLPEAAVARKLRARGVHLAQLQQRAAELQRGIGECASDEGWRLIQDGALRLLYRHSPGSTVHCFKGSCLLPAPLEQPLAMAREFDLVNSWNNYIANSTILRTFCDVDLLVYAAVWMPWPFSERDVLISAVADDRLREHGVVAVSFASPADTPPDVAPDLPPGADKRERIFFAPGSCMTMTPVPAPPAAVSVQGGRLLGGEATAAAAQQQTRVVIVGNIDGRIANVPDAIISFVLRVFAPFMFKTVLKVLHNSFDDPAQPLPQRMVAHHSLYDMLRQRCADFLDGHPD